jgi:hypothetical protein
MSWPDRLHHPRTKDPTIEGEMDTRTAMLGSFANTICVRDGGDDEAIPLGRGRDRSV